MIWTTFGANLAGVLVTLAVLAIFGTLFHLTLTAYRDRFNWEELYTPLAVWLYIAAHIAAAAVLFGMQTAATITLLFIAEKNIEMLGIEDTMIDSAHTMNHVEIKTRLMRMKILTLEALRHLESLGAPTRP